MEVADDQALLPTPRTGRKRVRFAEDSMDARPSATKVPKDTVLSAVGERVGFGGCLSTGADTIFCRSPSLGYGTVEQGCAV